MIFYRCYYYYLRYSLTVWPTLRDSGTNHSSSYKMKVDSSFMSLTVTATGKVNPGDQTNEIAIIETQKSNSVNVNHSHLGGLKLHIQLHI